MRFCTVCDNMMMIQPKNGSAVYRCFCCNTEDQEGLNSSVCISKRQFSKEDTEYAAYLNEYVLRDPTLPRVDTIKCANAECSKAPEQPNSVVYIKFDPTNMKYIYYCEHCHYSWTTK